MGEQFHLETPEAISVSYDIAGIGTRFLAAAIDTLAIVGLGAVILAGAVALALLGNLGRTIAIVLALILYFVLLFGYFVLYETLWSGQTPGKRALRIRVIKTSGYPISFVDAFIRNLVRTIDFLPSMYGVGVITMFISKQSRRLGDYAAGTLVVKERDSVALAELIRPASIFSAGRHSPAGTNDPEELEWRLQLLTAKELIVAREYLIRAPTLPYHVSQRIGAEIAAKVADRVGARLPLDAAGFLERVLYLNEEGR